MMIDKWKIGSPAFRLDPVVAHHSQIFVLEDMAVIEIKPGVVLELHQNLDPLAGQHQHTSLSPSSVNPALRPAASPAALVTPLRHMTLN